MASETKGPVSRASGRAQIKDVREALLSNRLLAVGCLQPPSLYLRREDRYIAYLNEGEGAERGNNSQIDSVTRARCPLPHLPQVKRRVGASPPG
eukprot:scaffold16962_cov60-Phaeocystis_antarctica.AAC.1